MVTDLQLKQWIERFSQEPPILEILSELFWLRQEQEATRVARFERRYTYDQKRWLAIGKLVESLPMSCELSHIVPVNDCPWVVGINDFKVFYRGKTPLEVLKAAMKEIDGTNA